jgi:hypothetical protein
MATAMTLRFLATVTGHRHDVIDAHPAGKQGNSQKEANNEYRDRHQDPCDRFKAAKTECLEYASAEQANEEPPDYGTRVCRQNMI